MTQPVSANAVAPAQPWWVNLFGHNHPTIRAALIDQLHTLGHVMLAGFTHGQVVELSERLAARTGLGHAFYGSDGTSCLLYTSPSPRD